jgi:hypothetical protein
MSDMRLIPHLAFPEWVALWSRCYDSPEDDEKYLGALALLNTVTNEDAFEKARDALKVAFEWKNGGRLSGPKGAKLTRLSHSTWQGLKAGGRPDFFSGAIWNIFLWHLATNARKPIFDQHSWRAYCYLFDRGCDELEEAKVGDIFTYYEAYAKWFTEYVDQGTNPRDLDKALMAFGQFLKSQFALLLERMN